MAEFIQCKSESKIKEFEEMARIKLFKDEEIRKMMLRREQFEHKLHSKENYMNYIKYEEQLLEQCRKRRDKSKIREKKDDIEYNILKKIKVLYNQVIEKFQHDVELKLDHIKFCMQNYDAKAASSAIATLTRCHPTVPQVWHVAADWQLEEFKDIEGAIVVLLKSLHYHNTNQELFKKCFKLELLAIKQQIEDGSKTSESRVERKHNSHTKVSAVSKEEEQIARAKILFLSASKTIKDVTFYIQLLDITKEFEFTVALQQILNEHLETNYSDLEITWHYLAQAELKVDNEKTCQDVSNPKRRILNCVQKYKEGISKIPSKRMWSYYLDNLVDLHFDRLTVMHLKTSLLKEALAEGHDAKVMDEKYYVIWHKLALPTEDGLGILIKGLETNPDSVELWKARLRYHMLNDRTPNDLSQIKTVFEQAVGILIDRALPLWQMYLQYHMLASDSCAINEIYESAVKQPEEISQVFKPQYIQWLVMNYDRKHARDVYFRLAKNKPYCRDLHAKMACVENVQIGTDKTPLEDVHKLACEQFGKENIDVWIDYVKFDLQHNKGLNTFNIQVQAKRNLPGYLHSVFDVNCHNVLNCPK